MPAFKEHGHILSKPSMANVTHLASIRKQNVRIEGRRAWLHLPWPRRNRASHTPRRRKQLRQAAADEGPGPALSRNRMAEALLWDPVRNGKVDLFQSASLGRGSRSTDVAGVQREDGVTRLLHRQFLPAACQIKPGAK